MPIIYFGLWCHKAGNLFTYDRVYLNNGKPTPIVIVHFRHVGEPPLYSSFWTGEKEEETNE